MAPPYLLFISTEATSAWFLAAILPMQRRDYQTKHGIAVLYFPDRPQGCDKEYAEIGGTG